MGFKAWDVFEIGNTFVFSCHDYVSVENISETAHLSMPHWPSSGPTAASHSLLPPMQGNVLSTHPISVSMTSNAVLQYNETTHVKRCCLPLSLSLNQKQTVKDHIILTLRAMYEAQS